MNVTNIKDAPLAPAYGILCSPIPSPMSHQALHQTFCKIPVGGKSDPHSHFETETFYIISGQGIMKIGDEISTVSTGDLIQIPGHAHHGLQNTGESDLDFLSTYSEDFEVPHLPSSVLITAAPPTPNGPLHLGHISGPYLASDVITRHLKRRGTKTRTHTGTDDHQNYVKESSRDQMRSRILSGLKTFDIQFDEIIEPQKDLPYQKHVQDFFKRAVESEVINEEQVSFPHCSHCDYFLVDALIEGSCPDCGSSSRGGCESCGVVVPPYELVAPLCSHCKRPADSKLIAVYTFDLKAHLSLILNDLEKLSLKPQIKEMIRRIQARKEMRVLLTHPGSLHHGVHVWFEMAAHYETFAKDNTYWIHHFGFDNAFHYLLFIPSLLRAMNPSLKLPDAVVTNEFLQLEGQKFSTSRNHAIWADEFLGNTDHLRLYLLLNRPDSRGDKFSESAFKDFSTKLSNDLISLGELPLTQTFNQRDAHFNHRMNRKMDALLYPSSPDFREGSRLILSFIDSELRKETSAKENLQTLLHLMTPFMPNEALKLARQHGLHL
jgi:methionyl-tRNA synthetase